MFVARSLFYCASAVSIIVATFRLEGDFDGIYKNEEDLDYANYEPPTDWDYQFIFPGTKWCGNGDIAKNYDDLGIFRKLDKCCRSHDKCDEVIVAGGTKHGLVNDGKYTKLSCKCDHDFFDCLKAVRQPVSRVVGTTYFNVLGSKCYEENYPKIGCLKWDTIVGQAKRCMKHEFDTTKPKRWQWFDVPRYISLTRNVKRVKNAAAVPIQVGVDLSHVAKNTSVGIVKVAKNTCMGLFNVARNATHNIGGIFKGKNLSSFIGLYRHRYSPMNE